MLSEGRLTSSVIELEVADKIVYVISKKKTSHFLQTAF